MGKAGVKRRAPPPLAMRVDQRPDFGLDARPLQRLDDETALPARDRAFSDMCCAAQPPQAPNQRQNGAARSGLGLRISTSSARRPPIRDTHALRREARRERRRRVRRRRRRARRARRSTSSSTTSQPWRAAIRNSFAPAPPSTGEGMRPRTVQPCATTQALTASQARASAASLLTRALDDLGRADLELRLDQADEPCALAPRASAHAAARAAAR